MPRLNGIEFSCWLKGSRFSCIPLIILTGSNLPEDTLAAYRCGAKSLVSKPVNVRQLDEIISHVLHYWRDVCQLEAQHDFLVRHCGEGRGNGVRH